MSRRAILFVLAAMLLASACAHVRPNDEVSARTTPADVKPREQHH